MNKKTLNTLLAGAVAVGALGTIATSADAMGLKDDQEKCYGVVKAGMNGCGAADGSHGCATMAKEDGSGVEWIALPKGTCEKLVGGSTTPIMAEADEVETKPEADEVETRPKSHGHEH